MPETTLPSKTTYIEAIFYSGKAAVSGVAAVVCFDLFHLQGAMWAAISAVIVTQPSMNPSMRASLMRVIANLIGAFSGAIFGGLFGHTLYSLAAGIMVTGIICHLGRLDEALRPAYAAVAIIVLDPGNTWFSSLERVYAVVIGCLISLVVGFLCDKSTRRIGIGSKSPSPPGHCE